MEKEDFDREILYRCIFEGSKMRMGKASDEKMIEKKLTLNRCFTRALTAKGGKLVKSITRESGAKVTIEIESREGLGEESLVLKGPTKSVNKAEQMLEEVLSSVVKISVSAEERDALLSCGVNKKECIMYKIEERTSVPLVLQGCKVLLYGKPEETKEAKETFEKELRLVKKVLSTS